MDEQLRWVDAGQLHDLYAAGAVTPTEYLRLTLDLVALVDPTISAFLTVDADGATRQAAAAERALRDGGRSALRERPLLGVPVSVKDLTATRGLRTTRGSLATRDVVPAEDAPAVARLRAAGAVVIGKTNTSEGGWSAATQNRIAAPTANPWDPARTAGGSSGGAAAAVAGGLGVAATGTDGAGSIRIPAAFCGVVGFKPTFGRVPYVPVDAARLSHLGPLTRSVRDAATLTAVLAGPDPRDPFSGGGPPPQPDSSARAGVRIGWVPRPGGAAPHRDVTRRCAHAVDTLAAMGHPVTEIAQPFDDPYPALTTILAAAEAADRRPGEDDLLDPNRLAVIRHGAGLSAVDLLRAERGRVDLLRQLDLCMSRFDLLAMPTLPIEPFARDRWRPDTGEDAATLDWLAWAPACYPFNLTGQPAISLPVGLGSTGLPVGLQLVGARHRDDLVLDVAGQLEAALSWRNAHPRLEHP